MKIFILAILVAGVNCGRRIVGGRRIKYSDAPYAAALFKNNYYFCAGSLISENFVLTAAHCFASDSHNPQDYRVRVGSDDRSNGGVLAHIQAIYIHPEFKMETINNDFTLLLLEEGIDFPLHVEFANLPEPNTQVNTGDMMLIAGWGVTESKKSSQYLLGAAVPIYDIAKCKKSYHNQITDAMICAGYERGKIDSCQGNFFFKK